ncbi:60S ribosome biogenesis protein Rrp14-domain-containing protein [Russula brevipes]|nr:60S ribosome biogenesis protein Rrp14-domain-containing protein [Russula brevipes]
MPTATPVLQASLEKHNETFESLLSLIPSKYYRVRDDDNDKGPSRYHKNKKVQQAPKQAIKEASKKARREKLDPANNKSALDIQTDHLASNSKGKQKASTPDDSDGDVLSAEVDLPMQDTGTSHDVPLSRPESIETLRAKLRAKIEAMRSKERGSEEGNSKDELLEERRLHRAALRERRRKATKARIQKEKEGKGKTKEKPGTAVPAKAQLLVANDASKLNSHSQLTNVVFHQSQNHHQIIRTAAQEFIESWSSPTTITSRKEKLAALPEEKRKQIEERCKVHDDETRLKKATKRNEKEKAKSKKAWAERKEEVTANMAARQKKRADNIASRNEKRKERHKGSKGSHVPGLRVKHLERGGVLVREGNRAFLNKTIFMRSTPRDHYF